MSNHGVGRTQRVPVAPNQNVLGEGSPRTRPYGEKFVVPEGMRAVKIYTGKHDDHEDVLDTYLDEDGKIGGEIADTTRKTITVLYPEERFKQNQAEIERLARARVEVTSKVDDPSVTTNSVKQGDSKTLEQHATDAAANAQAAIAQAERDKSAFNG